MWNAWINFILGIWLIVSAFIGSLHTTIHYIVVGVIVVLLSLLKVKSWPMVLTLILGILVIITAFFPTTTWTSVVFGVLIAIFALIGALMKKA